MTEDVEEKAAEEEEIVEEGGDEEGAAKPRRFRLSKPRLGLLGIVGLLLVGMGAGAYFVLLPSKGGKVEQVQAPSKPAVFYDLPDITVNLADPEKRQQYLRIKVALEVSDRDTISAISPMLPRVMDTFQVYLRELRITDLEGSAGIYRLKEELRRRINLAVHPAEVDDILFKELLIQ